MQVGHRSNAALSRPVSVRSLAGGVPCPALFRSSPALPRLQHITVAAGSDKEAEAQAVDARAWIAAWETKMTLEKNGGTKAVESSLPVENTAMSYIQLWAGLGKFLIGAWVMLDRLVQNYLCSSSDLRPRCARGSDPGIQDRKNNILKSDSLNLSCISSE